MDSTISALAALAATFFAIDLWRDHFRKPRPHITSYAVGMTMFAIATWCLFIGVTFGWTGGIYRVFFLFGAVLNIPFLALGSMFLVVGRRSGHTMAVALGGLTAISTTLVLTVPFQHSLPDSGIPHDMFATGFGPRLFAIIGGAAGATILMALALVSLFRFWRKDRNIVWGNALIVAGTFSAAWGGTGLALGDAGGFAFSLFLAVTLIWGGYRVASGRRGDGPPGNQVEANGQNGVDQLEGERA
jgi:hypothetical protein